MRSRDELLAASGYAERPADFETLLRILDNDLRLITPTEPTAGGPGVQKTDRQAARRVFTISPTTIWYPL